MPGSNYRIIAPKIGKRKRAGKESSVYWKGELVPAAKIRKESSRHGYMTTLERLYMTQAPDAATSPETPPGIEICTPPPYPLFQRVFLDLPILQFLRSTTTVFETTQPFMSSISALGSILHKNRVSSTPGAILAAAKSLMPISAFEEELPGSSITLNNSSHATSPQLLKVVAYAISNNFPGLCDREEIYRWLRSLETFSPHIITLLQDPSNQAILQGLLRLAVEEGDVLLARTLLDSGADPNENVCVSKSCPIALRPLQYSCLHGNLELVRELLRAKAQIDHPEFGWSCSPLLFCIFGCFSMCFWNHLAEEATIEVVGTGAGDLSDSMNDSDDDDDDETFRLERRGRQVEVLLTLIRELLKAGADVNAVPEDLDDTEYSLKEWRKGSDPHDLWYSLICEKHSALTLASSFRCPELVDLLILSGAEISFHIDGARSALRECLYISEERYYTAIRDCEHETLASRLEWCEDPTEVSRVVETAKRLIMAGVDVNDHEFHHPYDRYCEVHFDFECFSAFDLGILTQDRDLIDTLWSAGARPTVHSYDLALEAEDYDTFCQLLESEVDFPEWLVTHDEWLDDDDGWDDMKHRKSTDRQKRRAMILAGIQLGECASLENLMRSCDCSDLVENCGALLQEAIERCCARGYRDTLVCLLQSKILPQGPLASTLGSSIALAIHGGHLEMVNVLLAAGADVNAPLIKGYYLGQGPTPLRLAIRGEHEELVQKLLSHGAIDGPEYVQKKRNALDDAMDRGDLDNFRLILQRDVANGRSVSNSLHHALRSPVTHRQEFLRSLLDAGACPDTTTYHYERGTLTTLLEAISQRDPGCVKIILETQARTNEELPPGTAYSPLQLAAFEGNPEVVRMLLDHGQDPNIVSSYTKTSGNYQWYSRSLRMNHLIGTSVQNATAEKSYEILKILLQHGAKPDSTTKHCPHTALQMACREGSLDLVEVLIEYGANVNAPPAAEFGATALQFAAIGGYMGIAHLLLEKEADVNAEPAATEGRTALEGAAEHGRIDMVQLLRNAGADISESGGQVHFAAGQGHLDVVKFIVDKGADITVANNDGLTSAMIGSQEMGGVFFCFPPTIGQHVWRFMAIHSS
ncbi:ankyrin repeat-containing protein [Achaetomium macrosporum]|uniref:Ankyrin repeat-containing protein n=1 Tax=Achaetomium macrosporum TaxID=79813 RepID=A0AAN7C338_9PEZI|nr:ankyrin repeat-containing protein [Achaetomium macrosporum]